MGWWRLAGATVFKPDCLGNTFKELWARFNGPKNDERRTKHE
jgi:hypothetical protein